MTTWTMRVACTLLALAPAAYAGDEAKSKPAGKKQAVMINPSDIKWGEASPELPKGAQLAVLFGDPTKPARFTIRLKAPAGYVIPPHWHSKDEELTVVAGTLVLHMGDTMKAEPHELGAGAYHFLPAKMHHGAESKGDTVVQISGMGPFDIHYLNASDRPNAKSARK
ncbi:MAG: Cupin region [Myxococcales bacterium]|nr:Cupin region [Myxococcales bacterium]